jgi:hypothetical protein
MLRIPRCGRSEALRFFCSGQPPYSECFAFLVVGGPKRCALWPPREGGSIRASMQASCRLDPSSRGADLIQKESSSLSRDEDSCTVRIDTFAVPPLTACSHRKQPGRKPPSRACSVPDALPVTGKTVGFYSAGDRSGSQTVPGRVSGRNSGVMFRSALGCRFPSCRVCSAPRAVRDLSRLSGIVLRTLLSPSISFFGLCRRCRRIFDGVLPFTDDTDLCQYICYRGHLSRGGGQICVLRGCKLRTRPGTCEAGSPLTLRAGSAGQHPSRHV